MQLACQILFLFKNAVRERFFAANVPCRNFCIVKFPAADAKKSPANRTPAVSTKLQSTGQSN